MPAQPFTVHVDPDDLARHELAAAVPLPSLPESGRTDAGTDTDADAGTKHGARADRLAARQQSERARSSRAAGAAGGRSYAFRRS